MQTREKDFYCCQFIQYDTYFCFKYEKTEKRDACGVSDVTTAQLHSTKPEFRFCASSNPALGVSEIHDGEDLWQWSRLEITQNSFRRWNIPQIHFIIIILIFLITSSSSSTKKLIKNSAFNNSFCSWAEDFKLCYVLKHNLKFLSQNQDCMTLISSFITKTLFGEDLGPIHHSDLRIRLSWDFNIIYHIL